MFSVDCGAVGYGSGGTWGIGQLLCSFLIVTMATNPSALTVMWYPVTFLKLCTKALVARARNEARD